MIVALTGTPGTGKTTVADCLRSQGKKVMDLNRLLNSEGMLSDYDHVAESFLIDPEEISARMADFEGDFIIEGHLSHNMKVDVCIVLRCRPDIIRKRLMERGYPFGKVEDNMMSEALDIILVECLDTGRPTFEIDCTGLTPEDVSNSVMEIINGEFDAHLPGKVDWLEDFLKWS